MSSKHSHTAHQCPPCAYIYLSNWGNTLEGKKSFWRKGEAEFDLESMSLCEVQIWGKGQEGESRRSSTERRRVRRRRKKAPGAEKHIINFSTPGAFANYKKDSFKMRRGDKLWLLHQILIFGHFLRFQPLPALRRSLIYFLTDSCTAVFYLWPSHWKTLHWHRPAQPP